MILIFFSNEVDLAFLIDLHAKGLDPASIEQPTAMPAADRFLF